MKILQNNMRVGMARDPSGKRMFVYAKTAAATLSLNDSGAVFTNRGATGSVTLTLPANPYVGATYTFFRVAAQNLVVNPGANAFHFISGVDNDGHAITIGTASGFFQCVYDGTDWLVISVGGAADASVSIA